jgi:hypothetical protein
MKELGALIGPGIWIELASDTLIFRCPYRYSDMEKDLIRNQTLNLLEARLMELLHEINDYYYGKIFDRIW